MMNGSHKDLDMTESGRILAKIMQYALLPFHSSAYTHFENLFIFNDLKFTIAMIIG